MIATARARAERHEIAYAESPFTRFAMSRPRAPYCSDDVHRYVTIRTREVALEMRYIQVGGNVPSQAYLVFDVDRADAERAWIDARLPMPTFAATNPANGHAHLFWELSIPVARYPFASHPVRFMAAVEQGMTTRLGADECYVGLVAQNPMHAHWSVKASNARYDLPALAASLTREEMGARPLRSRGLGRNCDLFDWTRWDAYATVREYADERAFATAVAAFALATNREAFDAPLTDKETTWIAKSVARWTWARRANYTHGRKIVRRGAMRFEPLPPVMEASKRLAAIRDRQAAAGPASREAVRDSTRAKITVAVLDLSAEGKRVSMAAVARRTGIHRNTIQKHRDLLAGGGKVVGIASRRLPENAHYGVLRSDAPATPAPEVVL